LNSEGRRVIHLEIFPEASKGSDVPQPRPNALAKHRRQLKERGFARVEIRVAREDVPLVRAVAAALADPKRAAQTPATLRRNLNAPKAAGLKALLARATLAGVDLERDRDTGRPVEL